MQMPLIVVYASVVTKLSFHLTNSDCSLSFVGPAMLQCWEAAIDVAVSGSLTPSLLLPTLELSTFPQDNIREQLRHYFVRPASTFRESFPFLKSFSAGEEQISSVSLLFHWHCAYT